jgi:adenine-specific DNA-methyltransferase
VASVRVGAVSGADEIYASDRDGNRDFVTSGTVASGQTRRMIWCEPGEPPRRPAAPPQAPAGPTHPQLRRDQLVAMGPGLPQSNAPRVYVNTKTRRPSPFSFIPA